MEYLILIGWYKETAGIKTPRISIWLFSKLWRYTETFTIPDEGLRL